MTLRSLLAVSLLMLAPSLAWAADADLLLDAPEVAISDARSNLYLRGDVFYDFGGDLDGTRAIAQGPAFATAPLAGDLDDGAAFALGLGYRFTDMLRADLAVGYGEQDVGSAVFALPGCGSLCAAGEGTTLRTFDALASAYLDLGTVAGFTPYVGGGLGAVRLDYADVSSNLCGVGGCVSATGEGRDDWRFAYALDAGVGYDLTQALTLDVGYRYLHAEAGDAWRRELADGTALSVSDDGLDRHSLRLGLRYRFH